MTFPANITDLIVNRLKPKNDQQDSRLDAIEAMIADRHVLQDSGVSISTSTAQTDKINGSVTVDGGTYDVEVSYGWNGDIGSNDFVSVFEIDGAPVDITNELHRQEPKDVAGNPAVTDPLDLTRTNQAHGFTRTFHGVALTAGAHTVRLAWFTGSGGNEASIWGASIKITRVSL